MNSTYSLEEQISALADGHLNGDECARVMALVCANEDARAVWHRYQLVGEVLRSGSIRYRRSETEFMSKLNQRLEGEVPPRVEIGRVLPTAVESIGLDAANEPVFRWKLVAGFASLAAAAAIGWHWVGSPASVGPQLAQADSSVLSSVSLVSSEPGLRAPMRVSVGNNGAPQVMLRDARLDQLLEAHRQAGGASRMPSGFLRDATFESTAP